MLCLDVNGAFDKVSGDRLLFKILRKKVKSSRSHYPVDSKLLSGEIGAN